MKQLEHSDTAYIGHDNLYLARKLPGNQNFMRYKHKSVKIDSQKHSEHLFITLNVGEIATIL